MVVIRETTLPPARQSQLDGKLQLAQTAIQGATTGLCTALISLYLVYQHRRQRKLIGMELFPIDKPFIITSAKKNLIGKANGSAGYMKIVAILVESYALESVWILAQAILFYNKVSIFLYESRTYIAVSPPSSRY